MKTVPCGSLLTTTNSSLVWPRTGHFVTKITVKLQTHPGSTAGGVCGVRIVHPGIVP
jgi:hypothetical protein